MTSTAKFRINIKSGEVEIEGSEQFVEKHLLQLDTFILSMQPTQHETANESGILESGDANSDSNTKSADVPRSAALIPASFGEWMHSFKSELSDSDKALVTAQYVQSQSSTNDFKTIEVNTALKDHGIKLSNPSVSLKRLEEKKLIFQTRKVGKLKYMRLSTDGQLLLKSLRRKSN